MTDKLGRTIATYWDERAQSYSNGVNGELGDERRSAWESVVAEALSEVLDDAGAVGRQPRVADLGCGPGFFSVLLANMGCEVDAVDASAEMLLRAQQNVAHAAPDGNVTFHQKDLLELPFPDNTFDACISRNVTWLMRDPVAAYAEWLRVLRPGGRLVVFDANWYRYLVDVEVDAQRHADQDGVVLEGWDSDAMATTAEEKRCEVIAMELPLTPVLRPAWDVKTLGELGASVIRVDEDVWYRIWTKSEQSFYGSSPMFMLEAMK